MKQVNATVLNGSDTFGADGAAIDASQLAAASFQFSFVGDSSAAGVVKLQAGNSPDKQGYAYPGDNFSKINWVDIPGKSVTIAAGENSMITVAPNSYRWIRAVWNSNNGGINNVDCVDDTVGNPLAGKYFYLWAADADGGQAYYVWFKNTTNGHGTDPMIAGKLGIEVDFSTGDTADIIASDLANALALVPAFTNSGAFDITCSIINTSLGAFTPAVDVNTGFTISVPTSLGTVVCNMFGQSV